MGVLIVLMIGFIVGVGVEKYTSLDNQYLGAKKLIDECQRELKRTQKCVLIAVEDEPKSADANNNN